MGSNYDIILLNDGTIMSSGNNVYGQLGLGTSGNDYRTSFTKVPNISNVKQVSCGSTHNIILLNDGTLMVCGLNTNSQLGLGDKSNRNTFNRINIQNYLINKKSDQEKLYNINASVSVLLQPVTTMNNIDFENSFDSLPLIVNNTEYGRPIDKIDESFCIYKYKNIVSLSY